MSRFSDTEIKRFYDRLYRPGHFVVAGGTLFTMGPLFSRLAAELMTTGRTSYPVDIFHPERFGFARSMSRRW